MDSNLTDKYSGLVSCHAGTAYLWATRGARNPNLQDVITHALHVCSQHLFGLARFDLLSLAF